MEKFSELLDRLYFTSSNLAKTQLLKNYFAATPDPERGYAVAVIAGTLDLKHFKRSLIKELLYEHVDHHLFELSYDYVGDFSETVACLWPDSRGGSLQSLPTLSEVITNLSLTDKQKIKKYLNDLLERSNAVQRWALLKLGTGSLRIGISARFLKQVLAHYGDKDIHEIEALWHTLGPPYLDLFAWLEGKAQKPIFTNKIFFHPIMLSHALKDKDLTTILPEYFFVEWKYDGIRMQIVSTPSGKAIFSRTGDDISSAFPDILADLPVSVVLDGELVIQTSSGLGSFNQLQQRLNRKSPTKKLIQSAPAHIVLYDVLSLQGEDLRHLSLQQRRERLETWYRQQQPKNMTISPLLTFTNAADLMALRLKITNEPHVAIEGLMLKRKESIYIAGRPAGLWYKWKRDPYLVDAVLLYAQRGHGKRSSFYSDYTLGLWQDDQLLPIGKAYFGFTDEELKQLDHWIRHHTIRKFGPVREVEKQLVVEIAFDAVQKSSRHKSGYALRFPRINRIRWDKPAIEADTIASLADLIS